MNGRGEWCLKLDNCAQNEKEKQEEKEEEEQKQGGNIYSFIKD